MKLSEASVTFARNHIFKFYDSAFFVKPFEFDSIWADWDTVKAHLLETEIQDFKVASPMIMAIPKPKGGYRIVHQLSPLDSLVYTALTYEIAEAVEHRRVSDDQGVACSYRIAITSDGSLFKEDKGYGTFYQKSFDLSERYSHVLITDITNFYNSIYLHRLQNAIESCNPDLGELSKEIEDFLLRLNNGPSIGIPTGPAPSIIMSEALMIDIDEFILSKNVKYIRYVDDIRIFSNSTTHLSVLLSEITQYLYKSHRLTLSSNKTEIITSHEFRSKHLLDPESEEKREIHEALQKLDLKVNTHYSELEPEKEKNYRLLSGSDKIRLQAQALISLLEKIINQPHLDLGLARHILRRSRELRSRAIFSQLLLHFDFFSPVIRDVILYFDRITTDKVIKNHLSDFESLVKSARSLNIEGIRYWVASYLGRHPALYESEVIKDFLNAPLIDKRNRAMCAKVNKQVSWVRDHKDRLSNYGDWDRRGIINAGSILSRDERNHWMKIIEQNSSSLLDRVLAKHIRSM